MNHFQEVYNAIYNACERVANERDIGLYEVLPDEVPYPFILLARPTNDDDNQAKDVVFSDYSMTVHVWCQSLYDTFELNAIVGALMGELRYLPTKHVKVRLRNARQRVLEDKSINENAPLLHGVIELEYKIY